MYHMLYDLLCDAACDTMSGNLADNDRRCFTPGGPEEDRMCFYKKATQRSSQLVTLGR